ncbi:Hypothetical predicted protein [Podarcis lilfordi]|nr:Hypothetical predicted protein [Podarcis lilfordi]
MEATHESPIQAVWKPATREDARGPDSDEESVRGKTGTSLLRKLLCLKTPSGPEAAPAQRARVQCGPVAALSRTADPHGESPLKWKPRAKAPIPAEASSIAETVAADPVDRLVGWWATKPWRAFRAMLRSRAKKRSVLPESKRSPKAVEERDIRLPAEPETSPIARVDGSPRFSPTEDKTLASDVGETQEEDEGEHLSSRCGLEIHGRTEDDISDPATEREVDELCTFLSEGRRLREESRGLRGVFEWRGTCHLPGGDGVEAEDVADQAPELGDYGYWAEASDGEEQALADLAENPGGQGMLMATRDLGWLNSELLASPVVGSKEKRGREVSATSNPESRENGRVAGASRETQHILQEVLHLSSCSVPLPASPPGRSDALEPDPYDAPRAHIAEEERAPSPGFPQTLLTPLEPPPSFPPRGQGLQEGPPLSRPCQALAEDGGREVCQRRGSSGRKLPSPTEEPEAELGEEDDKQRLYQAAVEIVGAAIDAAAEQLAKAAEREQGELGSSREFP